MTEILRIPVDRELGVRVRWLITLRWMALGLALAAVVVSNVWLEGVLPLDALVVVLAAIAGYNTLFWVLAHRMTSPAAPYESHTSLLHATARSFRRTSTSTSTISSPSRSRRTICCAA